MTLPNSIIIRCCVVVVIISLFTAIGVRGGGRVVCDRLVWIWHNNIVVNIHCTMWHFWRSQWIVCPLPLTDYIIRFGTMVLKAMVAGCFLFLLPSRKKVDMLNITAPYCQNLPLVTHPPPTPPHPHTPILWKVSCTQLCHIISHSL